MHKNKLDQIQQLADAFESTQAKMKCIQYPTPDVSEPWKEEESEEITAGDALVQLQILNNAFLNLVCRQLFWLMNHIAEDQESAPKTQEPTSHP